MHIHPVQTTSSNTINRPTRDPVASSTMFKGIICIVVSKVGGHVDGDVKYLVFVKHDMLNTFDVLI